MENCTCGCCGCKKETVKVHFCPKCRSKDVKYVFEFQNVFGILPKMRCFNCGFENGIFPVLVVDKNKLNVKKNKIKRKRK